jgi:hypothetical protein
VRVPSIVPGRARAARESSDLFAVPLLRNTNGVRRAKQFPIWLAVRAAPLALLKKQEAEPARVGPSLPFTFEREPPGGPLPLLKISNSRFAHHIDLRSPDS